MIPVFVPPTVTLTTETSLDFPDQHSPTAWVYGPISSRATYTGRVVRTSRRAGAVFHVKLTHEKIDYPVPSRLIFGANGAWTDAKDTSVRGETEATVDVVTPTVVAGDVVLGPGTGEKAPDGERWQRSASFQQRGLIPSPQSPIQMTHKAEKKYKIGKVSDAEEAKQRQLRAILNKLTAQNFDRLFEQVKAVNIDNAVTLTGIISQNFEKALKEPTFCEMYANFCSHLAYELPDISEDNEKITFRRLLLNKCQMEFERGEREQEEANKVDEGEVKQSDEEREQRRTEARRRMLGNIRLIGELYKKKMLTERIMHECIKKLLGQVQDPDEEDVVEALCKLMSTIGDMIDHPKAKKHMDVYFERLKILSNNMNLSSRLRFMLKDVIDLRNNRWQQRRKVDGPKKIEEVHRDAVQERQAQAGRLGHGMGNNQSARRNIWYGKRLRDMSLSAIREYYSGRDENEVAECVKDLSSPSFHPSMVSLWITDSFERQDAERNLLGKLLVKLAKYQDGLLSQTQLIEGFETVLSTLEDAVNDAPKAPEFLGHIFAELITESLVSLNEIGKLIHDGGEEPGSLLEVGLAADILGSTLEVIKHEKGDDVLSEIRTSSNLRLESFRPPNSITSKKLEKFI